MTATPWDLLMNGSMIEAVYTMFDTAFGSMGIIVVILFFTYEFMLYTKTQSLQTCFLMGLIFVSLYAVSPFVEPFSKWIMFMMMAILGASILYMTLFSK